VLVGAGDAEGFAGAGAAVPYNVYVVVSVPA
jgi:hypothetical protein